jgi:hypothetical protein
MLASTDLSPNSETLKSKVLLKKKSKLKKNIKLDFKQENKLLMVKLTRTAKTS